eukprot:2826510-Amphidinium_carterae.1
MERRNASTTPGSRKPPIKATPLNSEQHSQYRAAMGQLLWVSQLRAAYAVKELSRSLQCPDEEDQRNLKQLLRYIKGTIHYKIKLEPKVEHDEKNQIKLGWMQYNPEEYK